MLLSKNMSGRLVLKKSTFKELKLLKALILIDLQNDFMPGGALAVPYGYEVVPLANQLMPFFDIVVATQDFHPVHHKSFASEHPEKKPGNTIMLGGIEQILWPDHCIQNQNGSELVETLNTSSLHSIFLKGTDPELDSYSAFFDNGHRRSTELDLFLKRKNVTSVFLLGLATDYCVKYSALDAQLLGFSTHVIIDACRPVEINTGDGQKAVDEMKEAGIRITTSTKIFQDYQLLQRDENATKNA
jgi:nicotinamidase/pyrazinamidase